MHVGATVVRGCRGDIHSLYPSSHSCDLEADLRCICHLVDPCCKPSLDIQPLDNKTNFDTQKRQLQDAIRDSLIHTYPKLLSHLLHLPRPPHLRLGRVHGFFPPLSRPFVTHSLAPRARPRTYHGADAARRRHAKLWHRVCCAAAVHRRRQHLVYCTGCLSNSGSGILLECMACPGRPRSVESRSVAGRGLGKPRHHSVRRRRSGRVFDGRGVRWASRGQGCQGTVNSYWAMGCYAHP